MRSSGSRAHISGFPLKAGQSYTLRGQDCPVFKCLKVVSHEGAEFGFMGRIEVIDALIDAGFEIREIWKMSSIEAFLLDEFPESLDQVQVG